MKNRMYAQGRLKSGVMNKTEALYKQRLDMLLMSGEIQWYCFEPANLRLADKCFYKPDFMVMDASGELQIHEVKGFWTDDALVKIKSAAEKFPFRFMSFKREKGEWVKREF